MVESPLGKNLARLLAIIVSPEAHSSDTSTTPLIITDSMQVEYLVGTVTNQALKCNTHYHETSHSKKTKLSKTIHALNDT